MIQTLRLRPALFAVLLGFLLGIPLLSASASTPHTTASDFTPVDPDIPTDGYDFYYVIYAEHLSNAPINDKAEWALLRSGEMTLDPTAVALRQAVLNRVSLDGGYVETEMPEIGLMSLYISADLAAELMKDDSLLLVEKAPKHQLLEVKSNITIPYARYNNQLGISAFAPFAPNADGFELFNSTLGNGEILPWNVEQYQALDIWDQDRDGYVDAGAPDGSNISFCIVDTGLYGTNATTPHDDFVGMTIIGSSQVSGGGPAEEFWEDIAPNGGHGTHVAGTATAVAGNDWGVVGVTPGGMQLLIRKVFRSGGTGAFVGTLISAINWCADPDGTPGNGDEANAISMSLGCNCPSGAEEAAFQTLYDTNGILHVAASGNSGDVTPSHPANYESVVAVGSLVEPTNMADPNTSTVSSFSQYPPSIYTPGAPPANVEWDTTELSGGGSNILSTWPGDVVNGGPPTLEVIGDPGGGTEIFYGAGQIEETPAGTVTAGWVDGGECTTAEGGAFMNGMIVVCQRGTVAFSEKVNTAESNGGLAAIIYNNAPGNFAGTCGGGCTGGIPGVSLSDTDGADIIANYGGLQLTVNVDDGSAACGGTCSGSYLAISGTSMATPGVASGMAFTWSNCGGEVGITNKDVRQLLRDTAWDMNIGNHTGDNNGGAGAPTVNVGPGYDQVTGWGLVQLLDAFNEGNNRFGGVCPPPPPPPSAATIVVTGDISSTQATNISTPLNLNIANTDTGTLNWTISEQLNAAPLAIDVAGHEILATDVSLLSKDEIEQAIAAHSPIDVEALDHARVNKGNFKGGIDVLSAEKATDSDYVAYYIGLKNEGSLGSVLAARDNTIQSVLANGGYVHGVFDRIGALSVVVQVKYAEGIFSPQNNSDIRYIEIIPEKHITEYRPEGPLPLSGRPTFMPAQAYGWNITQVQADQVWDADSNGNVDIDAPVGAGIIFCVTDTGYFIEHNDSIGGTGTNDTWDPNLTVGNVTGESQIVGELFSEDGHGHGTHVAGTINAINNDQNVVGIVPGGADLYIVKVFSNGGVWVNGESDLLLALYACRDNNANVLSMSLGGGASAAEEAGFLDLYENFNILNVAAAGNDGNTTASAPASYDGVISVASLTNTAAHSAFSQYPPTSYDPANAPTSAIPGAANDLWDVVELAAGGSSIVSLDNVNQDGNRTMSGTSMATPGVAAGVGWAFGACSFSSGMQNWQVRTLLRQSAMDLNTGPTGAAGYDSSTGWGLMQLMDAYTLGQSLYSSFCAPGVTLTPTTYDICTLSTTSVVYNAEISSDFAGNANMSVTGNPAPSNTNFSVDPVSSGPPGSDLTVSNLGSTAFGSYPMDVTATDTTDGTNTATATAQLNIYTQVPPAPALTSPANSATGVAINATVTWAASAEAVDYFVEVADDPSFNAPSIVDSATVAGATSFAVSGLSASTTYYWRVTPNNVCGNSNTSAEYSFTTAAGSLLCGATVDFEAGMPGDFVVNTVTGPTDWGITGSAVCAQGNNTNGTGQAACGDTDLTNPGGAAYETHMETGLFDLPAGLTQADLSFNAAYQRPGGAPGSDDYDVDIWNGTAWVELWSTRATGVYDITSDLLAYSGMTGLKIRYDYHGAGWDWYAQVDNISLTCAGGSPDFSVTSTDITETVCQGTNAIYPIDVNSLAGFNAAVTMSTIGAPAGSTSAFAPASVTPPADGTASSTLTVGTAGVAVGGPYAFTVNGNNGAVGDRTVGVDLTVLGLVAAGPALTAPADAATGVAIPAALSWNAVANATSYLVEVDDDPGFGSIDYTNTVAGTSDSATGLLNSTTYYWRVTASNACGAGVASVNWSFTTESVPACSTIADMPWLTLSSAAGSLVGIGNTDLTVTLDSTGLTPGLYTGNLCVDSNDVANPTVVVPVTLTVTGACATPDGVTGLAIADGGTDSMLSWTDVPNEDNGYEVWWGMDNPYFDPTGWSCASAPVGYGCGTTATNVANYTHVGAIGGPGTNYYYVIMAQNSCGTKSAAPSNQTAEFDFTIVPGA